MRFKCGLTDEEKARRQHERYRQRHTWRRKFAWFPLTIAPGICIWLEQYETRMGEGNGTLGEWYTYDKREYRLL